MGFFKWIEIAMTFEDSYIIDSIIELNNTRTGDVSIKEVYALEEKI